MSCPHRQRRCKHALSALSAAMYMYSVVQKSVADGEDENWDEDYGDDDAGEPGETEGLLPDDALGELALGAGLEEAE